MGRTVKPIAKLTKRERAAILRDPNARLSDLLEIAALDAIALQRQKRVKFNMSRWVSPNTGNKCEVCLAGAALYRTMSKTAWVGAPDSAGLGLAVAANCYRINGARSGETYREPNETRHMAKDALAAIRGTYRTGLGRAPFRVYLTAARKLREQCL